MLVRIGHLPRVIKIWILWGGGELTRYTLLYLVCMCAFPIPRIFVLFFMPSTPILPKKQLCFSKTDTFILTFVLQKKELFGVRKMPHTQIFAIGK